MIMYRIFADRYPFQIRGVIIPFLPIPVIHEIFPLYFRNETDGDKAMDEMLPLHDPHAKLDIFMALIMRLLREAEPSIFAWADIALVRNLVSALISRNVRPSFRHGLLHIPAFPYRSY